MLIPSEPKYLIKLNQTLAVHLSQIVQAQKNAKDLTITLANGMIYDVEDPDGNLLNRLVINPFPYA